jgi:hypothetical protein
LIQVYNKQLNYHLQIIGLNRKSKWTIVKTNFVINTMSGFGLNVM